MLPLWLWLDHKGEQMKKVMESYSRHAVVALSVAFADALKSGETDMALIGLAVAIAVVGPAIRAINPKDPIFGLVADRVTNELTKVATAETKKKKAVKKK